MSYIPPPKELKAFPDAVIVKVKTQIQGSGQKRRRWQNCRIAFVSDDTAIWVLKHQAR